MCSLMFMFNPLSKALESFNICDRFFSLFISNEKLLANVNIHYKSFILGFPFYVLAVRFYDCRSIYLIFLGWGLGGISFNGIVENWRIFIFPAPVDILAISGASDTGVFSESTNLCRQKQFWYQVKCIKINAKINFKWSFSIENGRILNHKDFSEIKN